ncbi:MAG: YdiU family protein [Acidobacteriota bacterium]
MPADRKTGPRRRQVFGAAFSRVEPTAVTDPRMLAYSREMASDLGLDDDQMASPEMAAILGGNRVAPGMDPFAACYGGHQFGRWAGQLGDGRAISLGEVTAAASAPDGGAFELQLKGAGPTPYSRTADGRAVLRSSVREFLCSEAMHHLGVPTTRALSLVGTGDLVLRDMFYDGHPKDEPGAVVCRVAPTFLRFGSLEIFTSRRDEVTLRAVADFALRHFYPELAETDGTSHTAASYVAMLEEISRRTAVMVAEWMRVGFVHGVMNTDNMSILGLTLDYGPYGWLEPYDPYWTPNTTDAEGRRYCFGRQPEIASWNLARFAEALHPLVGETEPLERALGAYVETLDAQQEQQMAAKLGLGGEFTAKDGAAVNQLFRLFADLETDMTLFFRRLAEVSSERDDLAAVGEEELCAPLEEAFYSLELFKRQHRPAMAEWLRAYLARVQDSPPGGSRGSDAARKEAMNRVNPLFVPRNYLVQLAIERAEEGDPSMISELLEVFRRPYDEQPGREEWAAKRPEWARRKAGCSMLSCSS